MPANFVTTREIRCEACGTLNRLPGYSVRRIPECGKCHSKLPETRSAVMRRVIYRSRRWIVTASLIGILACIVVVTMISGRGQSAFVETPRTAAGQPTLAKTCAKYLSTLQGLGGDYDASQRPALLTVRTVPGLLYLVKLDEIAVDSPALLFFVEGGQSLDASVPLGEFRLKYATGSNWCGDTDLFDNDTAFSEANDPLTFEQALAGGNSRASHLTIELPLQRDGKPRAKRISRSEFYSR